MYRPLSMTWIIAISMRERSARIPARGSVCGIGSSGMVLRSALADHLDILRESSAEEIQRFFQTRADANAWLPSGRTLKGCVVGPIVADIDRLSLGRKLLHDEVTAAVRRHQNLRELLQGERAVTADVIGNALRFWRYCGEQEGVDGVLDVGEVALLRAPPELERPAFQDSAKPHAHEGLTAVADAHAWTIGVGEAKRGGTQAVDAVIEQVKCLARELVDAVHVDGTERVRHFTCSIT